jgi:hypothetical protein
MDIFSSHCLDCVFDVKQHLMYMSLWYLGLKSDDEPFHQYQQIKQSSQIIEHNIWRWKSGSCLGRDTQMWQY